MKTNHSAVRPDRKGALIREVLIEREDHGAMCLCLFKYLSVFLGAEPDLRSMVDRPSWTHPAEPIGNGAGDVLIDQYPERVIHAR